MVLGERPIGEVGLLEGHDLSAAPEHVRVAIVSIGGEEPRMQARVGTTMQVLVDEVDDYNMSRLFANMACLRWTVVCDLRPYMLASDNHRKPCSPFNPYSSLYCCVQENAIKIGTSMFVAQLQKHELNTLLRLKMAVKGVALRELSIKLSNAAAGIQIENDWLEELKQRL